MKPRSKPGKAAGFASSKNKVKNPLSEKQMEHLRHPSKWGTTNIRAGRGGKRASWDLDYEEGCRLAAKPMPRRDPEDISENGLRRFGKRH